MLRVVNLATNLALNLGNYLVLMLDLYLELKMVYLMEQQMGHCSAIYLVELMGARLVGCLVEMMEYMMELM